MSKSDPPSQVAFVLADHAAVLLNKNSQHRLAGTWGTVQPLSKAARTCTPEDEAYFIMNVQQPENTTKPAVCDNNPQQLDLPDPGLSDRLDARFRAARERFRAPADQKRVDRADAILLEWALKEAEAIKRDAQREQLLDDVRERFGPDEAQDGAA